MIKNFKKCLIDIKNKKRVKRIETAFVHWYVDTRFEKKFDKKITDGPNDGGIDAVVFGDDTVFVIQAEFCNDIFVGKNKITTLSPKKYSQFDGLPDIFNNEKDFDQFLKTIDSSLVPIYKKVADIQKKNPSKVVWEITTLHSRSNAGERRLRNIDTANIRYASDNLRLYELSLEGATPPASPLELNFTEHFIVDDNKMGIKSYVAQVFLKDFIDYIDRDPGFRVLARNVRSELKDKTAKEIKNEMINTYLKSPWEFWYSHNGITIICERASIKGKKLNLISPYIINGAQTIHALKGIRKRDPKAKVLVRVIEIPSEEEDMKNFINSIIFRTNQQNRMYAYDLRANDFIQVELANEFLKHRVFYERRRGDWDLNKRIYKNQGIHRLKNTKLAQILMACNTNLGGVAKAKKSREDLFSDKYYNSLFSIPFEEIFFKYRLFLMIKESVQLIRSKRIKVRERNHALLSCLAIAWSCLESHKDIKKWFLINKNTPYKFSLENRSSKDFKKTIQELFKEVWKKWQEENRRDKTLSPNNFFKSSKWNNILLKKFVPKFRSKIQKTVRLMLA